MYLSVQPSQSPQPAASMASGPPFLIRSLQLPHPLCTRELQAPLPLHSAAELRPMIPLVTGRPDLILGSIANPGNHAGLFLPHGPWQLTFLFLPCNCRVLQWFLCCPKVPIFALFLSDM